MDGTPFDIFLSYNSRDRAAVERIAFLLRQEGFVPWFDASDLVAGGDWQDGIEQGLRHAKGCAVFLGPHGFGDWQIQEMKVAASMAAKDPSFRYFLVLLPGAPEPLDSKSLPAFITLRSRIQLREGFASPRLLKPLIDAIHGRASGPPIPVPLPGSPYRGLEAFDAEHAEFFFGRDADIRKLLDKLRDSPFLAVIGPSGSGKSSLVLAGLIPALRGGRLEGSADWPIVTMVPGAHPVESLAVALDALDPGPSRNRLLEELQQSPRALRLEANALLRDRPRSARLVLVVDQFEEIFTLCRDAEERDRFLGLLLAAAEPEGRCLVIITMRADFYPRITEYPALAEQVASHQLLVGALTKEGLTAAIEQPAFRQGVQFEPGLVSTILADVGSDAGALPLLQYALDELWKRQQGHVLTLEGYRASGGVGEAIATRANTVFEGLTPDQQAVARRVLLRLTQPGEATEDTRRRAELDELVTRPAERPAIEAAVNALVAARLLTASKDEVSGVAQVDVAHEALIRAWPRLRAWLDEDRQGLLAHRRLTEASQEWQRADRDPDLLYRGARLSEALSLATLQPDALNEQEREFLAESEALRAQERDAASAAAEARERLRRRILTGLGAFSAVALLLALLAGWQWREAGQQTTRAEQQAEVARDAEGEAQRQALAAEDAEATAQSEAARAESEAEIARTAQDEAQRQAAVARSAETKALSRQLAAQSRDQGDEYDLSMLLAAEAYTFGSGDVEGERALFSAAQAHPTLVRFLHGNEGEINAIAFSPDGALLASGSGDGTIRLRDPATGQDSQPPIGARAGGITALAFRPAQAPSESAGPGWQFASGSDEGMIQFWNVGDPAPYARSEMNSSVMAIAYSHDGLRLATADGEGRITIWNAETGEVVTAEWEAHTGGSFTSLAFSPDDSLLVSGGFVDRRIVVWDAQSGNSLDELDIGEETPIAVMFNPAGTILVTATQTQVLLWDAVTRLPLGAPLTGEGMADQIVLPFAMSGDGAVVAVGSSTGTVWQWDMATGEPIGAPLETGQTPFFALALNDDGSRLATGGANPDVRLWSSGVPAPGLFDTLWGHYDYPQSIAISPDNATIATGDRVGEVRLWDARTGYPLGAPLRGHLDVIRTLEFSPDGLLLAAASDDGTVRMWDTRTGAIFGSPLGGFSRDIVSSLAFSPSGEWLAAGGVSGEIRTWRLTADGVEAGPLVRQASTNPVYGLAFNPDGSILAAATSDGQLLLWDMGAEPANERQIDAGQDGLGAICFVDDATIATGGMNGSIHFWNASDGSGAGDAVSAHDMPILRLSCDPENGMLVSSSRDGRVLLWEVGASAPRGEWTAGPENDSMSRTAVLSPDGASLAFLSSDLDESAFVNVVSLPNDEEIAFPIYVLLRDGTLSADASRVAAGGENGLFGVWNATSGQQLALGHTDDEGGISTMALNADGSVIATGAGDGAVRLWRGASAEAFDQAARTMTTAVTTLALSETRLVAAGDDGELQLWDTATESASGDILIDGDPSVSRYSMRAFAFSGDGRLLASAGWKEVFLWNVDERELPIAPLAGHATWISALAFSPDDAMLASGDADGKIRLWDVASRQQSGRTLTGSLGEVTALAFSRDGARLAAGGPAGSIAIWDVASQTELGAITFDSRLIVSLAFSDDGSTLTGLDAAGHVGRWQLTPETWLTRVCTAANRNLTLAEWQRFIGDPADPLRPYHKTCADLPGPSDAAIGTPVAGGASATPVASGAAA